MTDLDVIAAVLGGLAVLIAAGVWAAAVMGVIEGALTLRVIPRRKRAAEASATAGEVVPMAQERGEAA